MEVSVCKARCGQLTGTSVKADQLAARLVEADLKPLDRAGPAVYSGLVDAVAQTGDDLDQAGTAARI